MKLIRRWGNACRQIRFDKGKDGGKKIRAIIQSKSPMNTNPLPACFENSSALVAAEPSNASALVGSEELERAGRGGMLRASNDSAEVMAGVTLVRSSP